MAETLKAAGFPAEPWPASASTASADPGRRPGPSHSAGRGLGQPAGAGPAPARADAPERRGQRRGGAIPSPASTAPGRPRGDRFQRAGEVPLVVGQHQGDRRQAGQAPPAPRSEDAASRRGRRRPPRSGAAISRVSACRPTPGSSAASVCRRRQARGRAAEPGHADHDIDVEAWSWGVQQAAGRGSVIPPEVRQPQRDQQPPGRGLRAPRGRAPHAPRLGSRTQAARQGVRRDRSGPGSRPEASARRSCPPSRPSDGVDQQPRSACGRSARSSITAIRLAQPPLLLGRSAGSGRLWPRRPAIPRPRSLAASASTCSGPAPARPDARSGRRQDVQHPASPPSVARQRRRPPPGSNQGRGPAPGTA